MNTSAENHEDSGWPWTLLRARVDADSIRRHEHTILYILTLIIGASVGLIVVAFILVTENLGSRMYPAGGAAWRRLAVPVIGALFTGYLLQRYFPNARGSGIPQTKTALFIYDGAIRLRTVVGKFFCSSVSLASGMALGREGPSVQVGAGIASVLGRQLGLGPEVIRSLIPIGASAALAAAFNTPIAAVLFTLEEVMGDLHARVLGAVVLSSATSWMVLHLLLGDEPLFHVPAYQLVNPLEFGVYAVLGIIGGLVSVCFVKLLLWMRKRFLRMPRWTLGLQPVAGGLVGGAFGWFVPEVLGVGYAHQPGAERAACSAPDDAPGRSEADRHGRLLCLRKRRRHIRPEPFHRRDVGRRGGRQRAHDSAGLHRQRRGLRAREHGQDILAAYKQAGGRSGASVSAQGSKSPVALLRGILAVLAVVIALIGFLGYSYHQQRSMRALQFLREGNELSAAQRYPEAIERYRSALSISHSSQARLALATALLKAGRLSEAEIYLKELIRENPACGPANLGLARIMVTQGNAQGAVELFHRAIFGAWPQGSLENSMLVRFELIETLDRNGLEKQAQAELLSLLSALPNDNGDRIRLGRLLLSNGLPGEAAGVFRRIIQAESRNGGAYTGLGDAEFAQENYTAAEAAYKSALQWNPEDLNARRRIANIAQIMALDPYLPGLNARERYERSRKLMEAVLGALDLCVSGTNQMVPASVSTVADNVR